MAIGLPYVPRRRPSSSGYLEQQDACRFSVRVISRRSGSSNCSSSRFA